MLIQGSYRPITLPQTELGMHLSWSVFFYNLQGSGFNFQHRANKNQRRRWMCTSGMEASIRDSGGGTQPPSCAISTGW